MCAQTCATFWFNISYNLIYMFAYVFGECVYNYDSAVTLDGNFSTPNWPNPYPNEIRCVYNFNGKKFQAIKLKFNVFELEQPFTKGLILRSNSCLTDYIDISTITAFKVKRLIGRYCGQSVPSPLLTIHPQLELIFTANHAMHGRGFHGHYEFIDESLIGPPESNPKNVVGCGGNETGIGGVLVSPNYPGPFPRQIDCVWLIRVKQDQHIYVRMVELQLFGSIAYCKDAQLAIYDGFESLEFDPKNPKQYCGDLTYYKNVEDKVLLSASNRLLIRFKSDITSSQWNDQVLRNPITGFKLIWTAVTFQQKEECKQFTCSQSQFCLKPQKFGTCDDYYSFCIDSSLQCNGLPNCSEMDFTDEEKCNVSLFVAATTGIGLTIILIIVCVCCCRRHNNQNSRKDSGIGLNRDETSFQTRPPEQGPYYAMRPIGDYHQTDSPTVPIDVINCSVHGSRPAIHISEMYAQNHSPYNRTDVSLHKHNYPPTDV